MRYAARDILAGYQPELNAFEQETGVVLMGTVDNDLLVGTADADTIYGWGGRDTLVGGRGIDLLVGGAQSDVYVVKDVLTQVVEETRGGLNDLVMSSVSWTLGSNVEHLVLVGKYSISGVGNELANTLVGNSAANKIEGGAGDDFIFGRGGADTLVGGLGNDNLRGGAGNDYLIDGDEDGGNDTFVGGSGNDTLISAGYSDSPAEDTDVFVYAAGDGVDRIGSYKTQNKDQLIIKADINDVHVYFNVHNIWLHIKDAQDTVLGSYYQSNSVVIENYLDPSWNLKTVKFSGGVELAVTDLLMRGQEVIGGSGDDTVLGCYGADTLFGGDGNDVILSMEDGGRAYSGANLGQLAQSDRDYLNGGAGDDFLFGGYGDDTLIGGVGNDTLRFEFYSKYCGSSTIVFNRGDGHDIVEAGYSYYGSENTLVMGDSVDQVIVAKYDKTTGEVTLSFVGSDDSVEFFFNMGKTHTGENANNLMNKIQFEDGSVVDMREFLSQFLTPEATSATPDSYSTDLLGL